MLGVSCHLAHHSWEQGMQLQLLFMIVQEQKLGTENIKNDTPMSTNDLDTTSTAF